MWLKRIATVLYAICCLVFVGCAFSYDVMPAKERLFYAVLAMFSGLRWGMGMYAYLNEPYDNLKEY